MNKTMKTFFNVVLALFVTLTSIPSTQTRVLNAINDTEYTNEDGVSLYKEATLVEGSLNEWDVDLKLQFDASDATHDIVLIVDTSGSMKSYDRLVKAKEASRDFVSTILSDDMKSINRVALITYGTGPTIQTNFTNSANQLTNLINNMTADGGTFTQAAIREARTLLDNSQADKQSIVLLTDGAPSFGYDLSETGASKYIQSNKEVLSPKVDSRDYEVYYDGRKWTYRNGERPSNNRQHLVLSNDEEANFLESDFNYDNNYGGHGSQALKYLFNLKDRENEYFINLYASSEAEAKFAKESNYDFYTVGLGLGNDTRALNMLRNMANDESKYFDADDSTSNLSDIFMSIADDLNFPFSNMEFKDPMGASVDYLGQLETLTGNHNTLNFDVDLDSILGTLTKDNFTYNKETRKYDFHIRYRVRTNENAVLEIQEGNGTILTNGDASLSYTNKKTNVPNESLFPKPSVKPTILAVTKELYDEHGNVQSLTDLENQREYAFSLKDNQEELVGKISHNNIYEYYVLHNNVEYQIMETGIVNDDVSRFDITYKLENNNIENQNDTGIFTLNPESGLNVLKILNRPNKDYEYENYTVEKSVKDNNGNGFAEYGETLTYEINITNQSDGQFIRNLNIQDSLEDLLPYIVYDANAKTSMYRNNVLSDKTFSIQQLREGFMTHLNIGETLTLVFEVDLIDSYEGLPETLLNIVKTSINEKEKTASKTIETRVPKVAANKAVVDANNNGYAEPNEVLTYTIDIENIGEVEHNNLFIQDRLDMIKDYIVDFETLMFTINGDIKPIQELVDGFIVQEFQPDEHLKIEFDIKLIENLNTTVVTELLNTALVDDLTPKAVIETGSSKIVAEKTVTDENLNNLAEPGETLNYEITIENKGKVLKSDVFVQDSLKNLLAHVDQSNFDTLGTLNVIRATDTEQLTISDLINGFELPVDAQEKVKLKFSLKLLETLNADEVSQLINTAFVDDEEVTATINTGMPRINSSKVVIDENKDGLAEANEKLMYVITIENNGTADKKNLFIQDTLEGLKEHTNVDSIKEDNVVTIENNGDTKIITLQQLMDGVYEDIVANGVVLISFTLTVNDNFDSNSVKTLSNLATVGPENPNVEIPTGKANITSTKSVSDDNKDGYAEPGERLTYKIVINNSGEVAKKNLKVQDTLSDLIPYINDIKNEKVLINGEANPLEMLVDGFEIDIDSGETIELEFSVTVNEAIDTDANKFLRNIATVGEDTPNIEIPTGKPNISATKSVVDENKNGYAEAGERLNYTIIINNSGEVTKENLWIQDSLDKLLDHIDPIEDTLVSVNEDTRALSDLINGFTIDIKPQETIEISFSVTVKESFDANQVKELNNIATIHDETPEVKIPTGKPNLVTNKIVTDENENGFAEAGEHLNYTISVKNTGPVQASSVYVQDTLSELMPHIESIESSLVEINDVKRPLQELIDGFYLDIDANETILINFSVLIKENFDANNVKELKNIATIGDDTPKIEIPTGKANINASKKVDDENGNGYAEAGELLTYTLSISNTGEVLKQNLFIQDNLEYLLEHIEDIDGELVSIGDTTRPLEDLITGFEIDIEAGEIIELKFNVRVKENLDASETLDLYNIATVGEETPNVTINTGEPIIVSSKSVSDDNGDGYAEAGEKLHYIITIENQGKVAYEDLLIKDDMSGLIDHIESIQESPMYLNGLERTLSELKAGFTYNLEPSETLTITFTVQVKEDFDASEYAKLSNFATVGPEKPGVEIPTGMPIISAKKSVADANNDKLAEAGERLDYTITVTNSGTVKKEGLFIQDSLIRLVDHINPIEDTPMFIDNIEKPLQNLVDGFEIDVDANQSIVLKFSVIVKDDFDASSVKELYNVATVGEETPEVKIPTGAPNISAIKQVKDENKDGFVEAKERLDYTIAIQNTGTVAKKDLFVQDELKELLPYITEISNSVITVNDKERPLQDLVDGFTLDVDPNESIEINFSVTVKDDFDAADVETLTNLATVGEETPEITIPTGKAIIVASKDVVDENKNGYAEAEERLDYTIKISNLGLVKKNNLFVQDKMEDLLPHIEDITDSFVIINGERRPLQDLVDGFGVDIDAKEDVILTFSVIIKENFDADTVKELSNLATIGNEEPKVEIPSGKPNLLISKKVEDENSNGYAEAEERLDYTISITNTGLVAKRNLFVQDNLEGLIDHIEDITDVTVSYQNEIRPLTELIQGFEIDVDVNETVLIEFSVWIKPDFDASRVSELKNIATVGEETPEVKIPSGKPQIRSFKEVMDENQDGYVEAGESVTYKISISNTGEVAKHGLEVKDDLSNIKEYIKNISSVTMTVNNEVMPLSKLVEGMKLDIDAAQSIVIEFTVEVKDDFDASRVASFSNLATVGDDKPEVEIPTGQPIIKATKTVQDENNDGFAEAGERLNYEIKITNSGDVKKENLFVQDDLKEIMEHIDSIEDDFVIVGDEVRPLTDLVKGFKLDIDAHDELLIKFSVSVKSDFDAEIIKTLSNLATVGEETPKIEIPTGKANIVSSKFVEDETGDGYAEANERLDYTINIKNHGNVKKTNLLVQDDLADLIDYINSIDDEVVIVNGQIRPLQDLVNGFKLDVEAGEEIVITFSVTIKDTFDSESVKTLSNLATIGEDTPNVDIPTGKAIIVATKEVTDENKDGYAEAGERLDYKLTIENRGEVLKRNVLIKDSLVDVLPYINEITDSKVFVNDEERQLQDLMNGFEIDVDANETIVVTFSVVIKDDFDASSTDYISNVAVIDEEEPSVTIPSGEAIIKSKKEVLDENNDGYAEASEKLTYTITINNIGNVKKEDLWIQDSLEDLIEHIENPNNVDVKVNEQSYSLKQLMNGLNLEIDAQEEIVIQFTVVVKDDFDASNIKQLSNLATVGDDTPEVKIPSGEAIIVSTKEVVDENQNGFAEAGERLDYAITITNTGNVKKERLFVQDNLENLIDHIEAFDEEKLYVNEEERNLEDLVKGFDLDVEAGETIKVKFSVKVKDNLDARLTEKLYNIASVGDDTPEVVIPSGAPEIVASKYVVDANKNGYAEAGERLDYTIKISNIGNVVEEQLKVIDTLEYLLDFVEDVSELDMYINGQRHDLNELMRGLELSLEPGEVIDIKFSLYVKENILVTEEYELINIAKVNDKEIEASIPLRSEVPTEHKPKTPSTGIGNYSERFSILLFVSLLSLLFLSLRRRYEK